jgi:sn-1 stearoyl-lipid 9-desaturase
MNALNDAAAGPFKVNSLQIDPAADQLAGKVVWDPARSIWNGSMLIAALVLAPMYFTWSAFFVFVVLLEFTMCAGHSVGFHRRLIHRTFKCPKGVERFLVWSGTLVGMQGPFWVVHSHDLRDWAQRQPDCHPYLRHGQGMIKDAFWSLHCKLLLDHPPKFDPGPGIADDSFHRFLQRTWMLHQIPIGIALYAIGGMPWLVWGVFVRVTVGVSMHWFVGYICHSHGPQSWLVNGGAVQAHNVPWAAIPSMGESWPTIITRFQRPLDTVYTQGKSISDFVSCSSWKNSVSPATFKRPMFCRRAQGSRPLRRTRWMPHMCTHKDSFAKRESECSARTLLFVANFSNHESAARVLDRNRRLWHRRNRGGDRVKSRGTHDHTPRSGIETTYRGLWFARAACWAEGLARTRALR